MPARLPHQNLVRHLKNLWHAIWELCNCCKPVLGVSAWTKKWIHIQKRSPVGPRYPKGDPFENNASVGSLFWVSICSSAACFPGSGRKEEPGKMEEPGLNFCRERFAIVLWTFCDFFPTFLPLMPQMYLMVACQCQNKSPAHFLLQIIAIF